MLRIHFEALKYSYFTFDMWSDFLHTVLVFEPTQIALCVESWKENLFSLDKWEKRTAVRKVNPIYFTIGLLWIETHWLYYVHKEIQYLLIQLDLFKNLNLSSIEYLSKINRVLLCKTAELRYILFSIWNY